MFHATSGRDLLRCLISSYFSCRCSLMLREPPRAPASLQMGNDHLPIRRFGLAACSGSHRHSKAMKTPKRPTIHASPRPRLGRRPPHKPGIDRALASGKARVEPR